MEIGKMGGAMWRIDEVTLSFPPSPPPQTPGADSGLGSGSSWWGSLFQALGCCHGDAGEGPSMATVTMGTAGCLPEKTPQRVLAPSGDHARGRGRRPGFCSLASLI